MSNTPEKIWKEGYRDVLIACYGLNAAISVFILFIGGAGQLFWGPWWSTDDPQIPPALAFMQVIIGWAAIIVWLRLWYRAWAAIQDGHARTTPGRAVGFMFIPILNLYWFFVIVWGFAKSYNAYLERHSLDLPQLPEGLFLTSTVLVYASIGIGISLPFLGFIPGLICAVIGIIVLVKTCDAINGLIESNESFREALEAGSQGL
jgi:hypothetical protein